MTEIVTRRSFVVRAAAASAAAGVGLAIAPGRSWAKAKAAAPPTGYAVGQTAPAFTGVDQYMRSWNSTQFKGWTLLGFSGVWCAPCDYLASQIAAFQQYLAGYGQTLGYIDVLLQDNAQNAATQLTAEGFAQGYGDPRGVTLQPNGVANDPLWQMLIAYTNAGLPQFAADPEIPTLVLIDPKNVIRLIDVLWGIQEEGGPSVAGNIAAAIGPSIPDPSLASIHQVGTPAPYSALGSFGSTVVPTLGLKPNKQDNAAQLIAKVQNHMAARTFSLAADDCQTLADKLNIWGVDGSFIATVSSCAQYLARLGSP
jgi:hypothetical protein